MLKYLLLYLICTIILILLYFPAFTTFFFQDDWYSLSISHIPSFSELYRIFLPNRELIYYRPLGMQLPFFISQSLFGINPLPFRIGVILVHLLNSFLAYKLNRFFLKSNVLSTVGAFLYLFSTVHYIIFYWAATFSFALAVTYYFSVFLLYLNKRFWLSGLLFI